MDKVKYTEGDWQLEQIHHEIVPGFYRPILHIKSVGDNWTESIVSIIGNTHGAAGLSKEQLANGVLMAAAPTLLRAAIEVLQCLKNAPERDYERNLLKTAIEKATK